MLSSKQRAFLRSRASSLDVILQIGKDGMTDRVIRQTAEALQARELMKGRVLEASLLTAREACDALCTACGADGVQTIGNVFVLYKRNEKEPKIELPQGRKKIRMSVEVYSLQDLNALRPLAHALLEESRVPHVIGCEQEAVALARRWGEREDLAAVAGMLHDSTKHLSYEEQLALAGYYGIRFDETELAAPKLLHARTGAALAKDKFSVCDEVASAIEWHTTGRPGMTALEKLIYLADYIEPTRDFPGVEPLRALAYRDLDAAMILGLRMSREEVLAKGGHPHERSEILLRQLEKKADYEQQ